MKVADIRCCDCGHITENDLVPNEWVTEVEYDGDVDCPECGHKKVMMCMPNPLGYFNNSIMDRGAIKNVLEANKLKLKATHGNKVHGEEKRRLLKEAAELKTPKNRRTQKYF